MKKRIVKYIVRVSFMVLALAVVGTSTNSHAITLGLPDISFDTIVPGSTGLVFDEMTNDLHVNAGLQTVILADGSSLVFDSGIVDYHMSFTGAFLSGGTPNFVIAEFVSSSFNPDLTVTTTTGADTTTLLTGNFVSASIVGLEGQVSSHGGTALFAVTGGTLAPDFSCGGPICGGMVSLTFNLDAPLTIGLFDTPFTGGTKGNIAPVPEPASLILMGSALGILGLWGRKKKIVG